MKVIKTTADWGIVSKCTGKGFPNRHNPCNYNIFIEKEDIVKTECVENNNLKIIYGFICMNCNCFTQIDSSLVPDDVVCNCPTVFSKSTTNYAKLSIREQILSDKL